MERIGYGETDSGFGAGRGSVKGRTIEGELVAKSVADKPSAFKLGDRVFHIKFGNGTISLIDGNKLTINFDKAGQSAFSIVSSSRSKEGEAPECRQIALCSPAS